MHVTRRYVAAQDEIMLVTRYMGGIRKHLLMFALVKQAAVRVSRADFCVSRGRRGIVIIIVFERLLAVRFTVFVDLLQQFGVVMFSPLPVSTKRGALSCGSAASRRAERGLMERRLDRPVPTVGLGADLPPTSRV
jgi:hypothetical protein